MDFRGVGDGVTKNTVKDFFYYFSFFLTLMWLYTWNENNILFWLLVMLVFTIY